LFRSWMLLKSGRSGGSRFHLHRHMRQIMDGCKLVPVIGRRLRLFRDDGNDGAVMARPKLPDMQVGYFAALADDDFGYLLRQILVFGQIVEQGGASVLYQAP